MVLPVLPLLLIIGSGVVYHVAQRAAAGASSSPWPLLTLTYGVAFVACLAIAWAEGGAMFRRVPERGTLLAGVALGMAVLGVELGFFLAYRAGSALNSVSVLSNLGVTAALAVIGIAIIGEAMSAARLCGIGLAAGAAWLIVHG
jgi:drug/metabolite transporter (DMT)-like permease